MARYPSVEYVRFRTDGSAARKVEVAAPIKTMRLPRVKKQNSKPYRIDLLSLTAIIMTVCMMVFMFVGLWQLDAAQKQTRAMEAKVAALQKENEALQEYYNQHLDLDQMERTAMALGMIPEEQATHVTIRVPQETVPQQPDMWERITTFLTGLFA